MMKNKTGKITPNGVSLQKHENDTVVFFTERGFDIELIPKSNRQGIHTPDIIMIGKKWEIKSPIGRGHYLMTNTLQKAVKQSPYIIIDLRRVKRAQIKCLRELRREFRLSKSIKMLKIITKAQHVIDYQK